MAPTKNMGEGRKELRVASAEGSEIGAVTEQGSLWPVAWPSRQGYMPGWYHLDSTGRASRFSCFFLLRDLKVSHHCCITVVLQSSLGRKKDFNLLIISTQLFHLCTCNSLVGCLSEKCIRGKIMTYLSAIS